MFTLISASRSSLLTILLLHLALLSGTGQSATPFQEQLTQQQFAQQKLTQQRSDYSTALAMARKGQWQTLRDYRSRLQDYPLYEYLVYADLSANLHYKYRAKIADYLARYQGNVKEIHLRNRWLDYLSSRGYWTAYTEFYRDSSASSSQRCNFYLAHHRLGNKSKAVAGGLSVWVEGKSLPKTCDKLFGILIKGGHISEKLAWQRFNAALLKHNYQLARYLKRFFRSPNYKRLYQLYYDADRKPHSIGQRHNFTSQTVEELNILERGLGRLAARNAQQALKHWTRYQLSHEFSHSAQARIISAIIKNLYAQGHRKAADSYHIDNIRLLNQTLDGSLTEWRIRQSLAQLDWPKVRAWLGRLPHASQEKPLWRYWQIRSLESDPSTTENPEILQLTRKLAKERDFYGFLASERIGAEYSINHHPLIIDRQRLDAIAAMPAIQRARELHFHGSSLDANREWASGNANFQYQDWLAAAVLASQWRWHNKAIASLGTARYWDDVEIRFPLAYKDQISAAASKTGIPDYSLFALARQESAFNPSATSGAGARGLIQVMPATASATARKYKIPYRSKTQLHNAGTNLAIGASYYRGLLEQFDYNRILATAAYNAGPSRVNQWLAKSQSKLPFDVWMTLIPYRETRSYVSNVLMYSVLYSRKLGLKTPLLTQHEKDRLL